MHKTYPTKKTCRDLILALIILVLFLDWRKKQFVTCFIIACVLESSDGMCKITSSEKLEKQFAAQKNTSIIYFEGKEKDFMYSYT